MIRFNFFFVLVGALLAASAASFELDVSGERVVPGATSLVDKAVASFSSRDLLQRRRRRRNRRNRRTNKKKGDSGDGVVNVNGEGALFNQEVSADIYGDSNAVVGGVIGPTFNANVDIDEIAYDRRRLQHLAGKGDPSASRDLLQRRRRRRRRSRRGGKDKKKDSHEAFGTINVNGEGVLVNQEVSAKIDGDSNTVKGGYVSDIDNFNLSVDEVHTYSP